ncbi:carbamoyltransferase family protein [Xenorhabdus ishibashii]|uniref:Carbamoyltransferase n=1 Tax=Xenorhabdus ishibashii TaxID=1034471 RepID=A0A2D0KE32_9GAMM|nr:carbamoyltransferase C-terminal domain-containing protein [Xenorhabdus ishibashii]PHM61676.1 carbamoyltransferase [Xenorhabdus ishibashii]
MIVLGLSGLPQAQKWLTDSYPNINPLDTRICQGLDSAACIVVDGKIIAAAAEERFTGIKGTGQFPQEAIAYCLQSAGVTKDEVDIIAHGFNYNAYRRFFISPADKTMFDAVYRSETVISMLEQDGWTSVKKRFRPVDHHLAHAASAFFPSGFNSALCIVADGMGETESVSIFNCHDDKLERLSSQSISSSPGICYSICTRFLGFMFNSDEYKVMGLAAYGNPEKYSAFFEKFICFDDNNGQIVIRWPQGALKSAAEGYPHAMAWLQTSTGLTPCTSSDELSNSHTDFAAALQKRFAEIFCHLTSWWLSKTGHTHLCLAGGVFLNCRVNQQISTLPAVSDMFIQPASGDDGSALGAALACLKYDYKGERLFSPYLGPSYTDEDITAILKELKYKDLSVSHTGLSNQYFESAAQAIKDDLIIAWFNGRMEFGPRALGNRSILALPSGKNIKERINRTVKFREGFRPFAPAVTDECLEQIFDVKHLTPYYYMLSTTNVREGMVGAVSGVIHTDGTARTQVVSGRFNPVFYRLLQEVSKKTGYGCVVNTSFNVKGQPLILDPRTALETFMNTSLDKLYLQGFIVCKR